LKSESGVGRKAEGEGISHQDAKVIIFQKFRPDPGFLDCGGLTPLWIFPSTRTIPIQSSVKPEHSKTPSWQQNVFGNCTTWARQLTENLLLLFLCAFASSREPLPQSLHQASSQCPRASIPTRPPLHSHRNRLSLSPSR
jgi:hypothetical protein